MSVASDLKQIEEAIAGLAGPAPETITDEDLAARIDHMLAASGIYCGAAPSPEIQDLIEALGTSVETLRDEFDAYHAARNRDEMERWGVSPDGSLDPARDFRDLARSATTSVPQHPRTDHPITGKLNVEARAASQAEYEMMKRNEAIVSTDFERARANDIGKSDLSGGGPRQTRSITGGRWKR